MTVHPENLKVKYNLALTYLAAHDYEKAEALKDVVLRNPKDIVRVITLVLFTKVLPDYEQALAYYRQYLKYAAGHKETQSVKEWVRYIQQQID